MFNKSSFGDRSWLLTEQSVPYAVLGVDLLSGQISGAEEASLANGRVK